MKRSNETSTELPILPGDIINTIHQNFLKYIGNFEGICNWHATQKSFYKEWRDLEYLSRVVNDACEYIYREYKKNPHGTVLKSLHKLKFINKSLSITKHILTELPTLEVVKELDCVADTTYIIETKNREKNLVYLFDENSGQVDQTTKTPLRAGHRYLLTLVWRYLTIFQSWEIMIGTEENKSTPLIFPELNNVFLESYLTVRIFKTPAIK